VSIVRTNSVQIGQSTTATNNGTWYQPGSPDGTIRYAIGNAGATSLDVLTLSNSGQITVARGATIGTNLTVSGNTAITGTATVGGAATLGSATVTGAFSAGSLTGTTFQSLSASLRANRAITGGGNITFDGSGNLKWTARFIVISNGRGTHFSTSGYFDIDCPTSGTITGVGGASNQTATASGIPLPSWSALYYIPPIGSGSGSVAANFRVMNYTSDFVVPDTWILIAIRNDDGGNNAVYLNNGVSIKAGATASNLIQTVYLRYDGKTAYSFAGAGGGATNISDLNTTITPRLASNRILVNFCPSYEVVQDTVFKLYRSIGGGADVDIATNVNDANYWSGWTHPGYDADNSTTPRTASLWFLDSPNTTSAVTYKLMIQSSGSGGTNFNLNRTISSTGTTNQENGISQVFLQEIGL
jgi:hypothetical protein